MSALPQQTAFETTDRALVEAFLALLSLFVKTETAPLKAADTRSPDVTDDEAEASEDILEIIKIAGFEVDKLMASRLAANDRKTPLLHVTDAERIVSGIVAAPTNKEVAAIVQAIVSVTELNIKDTLLLMSAFDTDPYTAFWKIAAALTNEAVRSGRTLKQVARSPESRANVYRATMSYKTWRQLTTGRSLLLDNISISDVLGGKDFLLADDPTGATEERLASVEAGWEGMMSAAATNYRDFYTRLGKEIWPAGSRR